MITLNEFAALARTSNVIPLVSTMLADMHTPVSAYLALREGAEASFLFESVEPNERIGRHSFLGVRPLLMVRCRGDQVQVIEGKKVEERSGNVFDILAEYSGKFRQAATQETSGFLGGFVGYVGYDNVRFLEAIPIRRDEADAEEDAVFGLFTSVVRFDHQQHLMTVVHNVVIDEGRPLERQYEEGKTALEALLLRLRKSAVATLNFQCDPEARREGTPPEAFCAAVRRAKQYILEGDIFQVVLSRRTVLEYTGDLFAVYRALRVINPSPYLFYVDFGAIKLAGSSPEVLVRAHDGQVEVLPIAGTRPRGATEEEDVALEKELLADAKEVAEHIMLVDLGRNDVGRISEYGSVEVPVLKRVERYSHVMHLVSEVRGKLRKDAGALGALKACFPAGTVSGAPKVRAMEIIQELEGARRGIYAGAVGYLAFNGTLDTCIAIRTIVARRNELWVQAGAGIVADSIPEKEYEETGNKARALLEAVRVAAGGFGELAQRSERRNP